MGVAALDDQHARLLATMTEITNCIAARPDAPEVKSGLERLHSQVAFHFRDEERHMQTTNFPSLAEHQREHIEFMALIGERLALHSAGVERLNLASLSLIADWLLSHMQEMDAEYARYLRVESLAQEEI